MLGMGPLVRHPARLELLVAWERNRPVAWVPSANVDPSFMGGGSPLVASSSPGEGLKRGLSDASSLSIS